MAKIAQINEGITAFGGINFVLDKYDALLGDVTDWVLGIHSTSFGYQYSEIVRALFAVYLCNHYFIARTCKVRLWRMAFALYARPAQAWHLDQESVRCLLAQ